MKTEDEYSAFLDAAIQEILPQLKEMMQLAIEEAYRRAYPLRVIEMKSDSLSQDTIDEILNMWRSPHSFGTIVQFPDYAAMWTELKTIMKNHNDKPIVDLMATIEARLSPDGADPASDDSDQ